MQNLIDCVMIKETNENETDDSKEAFDAKETNNTKETNKSKKQGARENKRQIIQSQMRQIRKNWGN